MTTKSMYFGKPVSANAFPAYSTAELKRDLTARSLTDATRAKIEAEITRRADECNAKRFFAQSRG